MKTRVPISRRSMLFVLHPVFALTGVADAIAGPMLPSLARTFRLSDSESGVLLFSLFAGMAVGALLCRGNYARILTRGLLAMAITCSGFPWVPRPLLYPFGFFLGASIGAPMTAISLFIGRNYPARRASTLTMLNFTWSVGATLAPLFAARVLAVSNWGTVYLVLAGVSALAAIAVHFTIRDSSEAPRTTAQAGGFVNFRLVSLFAFFFFLEVGMESTFGAWISTYVLRTAQTAVTFAAGAAAIYWAGFLLSRALSPLILLRIRPGRLLQAAVTMALCAAALLVVSSSLAMLAAAILLLGMALAPIFPVALAAFFDRARHSADTRFVLAVSGFGGSVFPGLVGWISSYSGSLRTGLIAGPATLLVMVAILPLLSVSQSESASAAP
jgi:fucose permease